MAQPQGTIALPVLEAKAPARPARPILDTIIEALDGLALTQPVAAEEDGRETLVSFDLDGFRYALTRRRLADDVRLSPREAEIIRLVANGLPNKCIGAVLDISAWTVATHLRRIFAKLGVNSRAAMIARAAGATAQPIKAPLLGTGAGWHGAQKAPGKAAGAMHGMAQGQAGRAPA